MNKRRRKEILDAKTLIEENLGVIREAIEEEEEYFDNMPENLQYSEKGDLTQEVIGVMEDTVDEIESLLEELMEAVNN